MAREYIMTVGQLQYLLENAQEMNASGVSFYITDDGFTVDALDMFGCIIDTLTEYIGDGEITEENE